MGNKIFKSEMLQKKYQIFVSPYNFEKQVKKNLKIKKVNICDTTVRDGEQTPGVVFSREEKIKLARMLSILGVFQIEVGCSATSKLERKIIKEIVQIKKKENWTTSIMVWSRPIKRDIDAAIETGCDAIAISIATSDIHLKYKLRKTKQEILEIIRNAILYAKSHHLYISINAEDASRTDLGFLIKFGNVAKKAGADRIRLCDTVSAMNPSATKFLIKRVRKLVNLPIEIHAHNDYGLALANSLAAIEEGAEFVSTTVNGIGERCGNCSLEQIIMCLTHLYDFNQNSYKINYLKDISNFTEKSSAIKISAGAPFVGKLAFTHESGIHVDGLTKYSYTYESFPPEILGRKRNIVLGKHSGKASIKLFLKKYGIICNEEEIFKILEKVKTFSEIKKRCISSKEFLDIVSDIKNNKIVNKSS